jgi:hypothetical protein
MLSVKKFLWNPDYERLPEIIRSDPIRLRKEFLSVAVDPTVIFPLRTRSFRILTRYAQVFGLFTPLERQSLTKNFENEFPTKRLQEVTEWIRSGSTGHCERWLVFWYCVAVARITLDNQSEIVNATREVYKGTSLGSTLEVHLSKIERLKSDGTSDYQMEAG